MRLAFIVSHPIQYYVPIYRELAELARQRTTGSQDDKTKGRHEADRKTDHGLRTTDDKTQVTALKVFYTWRDAGPALDEKFGKTFSWDIPLMEGYDFEVVPNTSPDPGTHRRKGLINPDLVERVKAWKPDAVHITGYNYVSHGQAIKELSKAGIPVIFRGDSHLLDGRGPWWKWQLKKLFVSRVYHWPKAFSYVGQANRDYYRAFGVPENKLFHVPHTIEVGRFAEPNNELEAKALAWRRELGIPDENFVFLYAAKLEPRKRPDRLLESFVKADIPNTTLLFVGSGALEAALRSRVAGGEWLVKGNGVFEKGTKRVVFLEFQNQSAMPVVYRLGDVLVLPSGYAETWGLAVNEAQACGRPSLVSDCVGCARDIISEGKTGEVFRTDDWDDCIRVMRLMAHGEWRKKREAIRAGAVLYDTARGVDALLDSLSSVEPPIQTDWRS
jgi:glycosyltransferase involved in cell wall biosynthesis